MANEVTIKYGDDTLSRAMRKSGVWRIKRRPVVDLRFV
jgi:hypothetical protein